jgi:hypothetical protein
LSWKKAGESANAQMVCVLSGRSHHGYSLANSRDEAISAACALLDQKMNVQEIGRVLGTRDPGDIIDSVEIRKLHAMRIQSG